MTFLARIRPSLAATISLVGLAAAFTAAAQTGYTGIFGGGVFYKSGAPANIAEIEQSGFTEVIVWSVEVGPTGDLNLNGEFPLTSNGAYIGNQTYPAFAAAMAQLKQGTVKRITLSLGSSNYGDWEDVAALVRAQGTGPDSILYRDFQALKAAIPSLDAVDFDDENSFDAPTTIAFAVMLGELGYHVAPDAYDNVSYWQNVVTQVNTQRPGTIDGVHLQAYAGGAGNSPCVGWNFGAVPVWPGLWDQVDTPSRVQSIMSGWHGQCGIGGGFLWLYDDIAGTGKAAQYASAINTAVGGSGFTLTGPKSVAVNQGGSAPAIISIKDLNGFSGTVALAVSALPRGLHATIEGSGAQRKIVFRAAAGAPTGTSAVTVTGTSGSEVQAVRISLSVNAGIGTGGSGTPVDLSGAYALYGIYADGTVYTTTGLDGGGYSYSANLLTPARILNGVGYLLGPAGAPDAVPGKGQSVALPAGSYHALGLLATGVGGDQAAQVLVVTYTDGSSQRYTQSFSDWYTPAHYPGESLAVAMPYRNAANGTRDARVFNLYAYQLTLDPTRTVASLTLPADPNVVVLAATLQP